MSLTQKDHLPDHAFWRFILKMNENELARKTLTELQHIIPLQINLLLFCCWFAQAGQGRLTKQDLQELIEATANYHERIVVAFEKLQLQAATCLYTDLKYNINIELEFANHIEQMMLIDVPVKFVRSSRTPMQKLTDACKNIAMYCKTAHLFLDHTSCERLFHLLASIFSGIDLLEIQKTCKAILLTEATQPASQGRLF